MLCLVCGREISQVNEFWLHKEYDATHQPKPIPDELLSSDKIKLYFTRVREDVQKKHLQKLDDIYRETDLEIRNIDEAEKRIIELLSEANYAEADRTLHPAKG